MIRLGMTAPTPIGALNIKINVDGNDHGFRAQTATVEGRELPIVTGASILGVAARDCSYQLCDDADMQPVEPGEHVALEGGERFCVVPYCTPSFRKPGLSDNYQSRSSVNEFTHRSGGCDQHEDHI